MFQVGVAGTMTGAPRHVLQPSSIEKSPVWLRFQIIRQILQVCDAYAMELDYFANLQGQHDALCGDFGPHRYHLQSRVGASKPTPGGTASQILCLYLLIRFPIMIFTANVLAMGSRIKALLDYSVRSQLLLRPISCQN